MTLRGVDVVDVQNDNSNVLYIKDYINKKSLEKELQKLLLFPPTFNTVDMFLAILANYGKTYHFDDLPSKAIDEKGINLFDDKENNIINRLLFYFASNLDFDVFDYLSEKAFNSIAA